MKENIRNTKNSRDIRENNQNTEIFKKIFFFFFTYKMVVITVQNYTNAEVHTINAGNRELFWVKMIDVHNGRDIKNILT